jgi:hypothetical protein
MKWYSYTPDLETLKEIQRGKKTEVRLPVKDEIAIQWLLPGMFTPEFVADPGNMLAPLGHVGDKIWVRETFSLDARDIYPCPQAWYKADFDKWEEPNTVGCNHKPGSHSDCFGCWTLNNGRFQWKSPVTMPRRLSRMRLHVVDVRIERLDAISDKSCFAEGILDCTKDKNLHKFGREHWRWQNYFYNPLDAYRHVWENKYGMTKYRWNQNPWVWVTKFRRDN